MRLLFVGIVVSVICGILPSIWPDVQQAWDVYAICTRFEVLTWLIVLFLFLSYRRLLVKTTVLCLCAMECMDLYFMSFYWGAAVSPYFFYLIKSLACVAILARYIWRNYENESDSLDEEHFFSVGIIPDGFQDFILSLIKDPVGGVGIYAQGNFYHYRKGRLLIHSKSYLLKAGKKYRIRRMRKLDKGRINMLESLRVSRYSTWSWIWNCKTVLEPILSERGRPYFTRKNNGRKQG